MTVGGSADHFLHVTGIFPGDVICGYKRISAVAPKDLQIAVTRCGRNSQRATPMALVVEQMFSERFPMPESSLMTQAAPTAYSSTESDDGYETPPEEPRDSAPASADGQALMQTIVKQLEYYFSDENLQRDAFMTKHIARNKEGYVSLKLIASLRKVKAVCKDLATIKEGAMLSKTLSLNSDGTKIRRLVAPPKIDYSVATRSVLLTDLLETVTAEGLKDSLDAYGEVVKVRVFQPKKAIPLDIKVHAKAHKEIGKELFAVAEFKTVTVAENVCQNASKMQNDFKVKRLGVNTAGREASRDVHRTERADTAVVQVTFSQEHSSSSETEAHGSAPSYQPPRATSRKNQVRRRPQQGRFTGHFLYTDPHSRDSDSGCSQLGNSPSPSPEPVRRFRLFHSDGGAPTVSVVRQPKGPDGTRGFHAMM